MFKIKYLFLAKDVYFYTIVEEWLLYKQNSIKESTYLKYKYIIKKYFYPELKNKNLKELLNFNYNNFLNELIFLNTT